MKIDVTAHKDLPETAENVVTGGELAGADEANLETDEAATGVVVVATVGEASTGADKPSVENMLTMLVVVTVMITTSVEIGGGGEMMSRRPGTTRVTQEQMSSKNRVVNSISNGVTLDVWCRREAQELVSTSWCGRLGVA